jgi:uncharacterized membrane protein
MSDQRMSDQRMNGRSVTDRLEPALARVLQTGTYVSMALVALGTLLFIGGGGSPLDGAPTVDLAHLPADLAAGRPTALLWLGVLGTLLTPGLRVVGAMIGFARAGEWRMAAIAVAIVVVVGVGIAAGLVTG